MAWFDVMTGRQAWTDYISTQDQIRGFEKAFEAHRIKTDGALALTVSPTDREVAYAAGLGALGSDIRQVGVVVSDGLQDMNTTMEIGFGTLGAGLERLGADFNVLMGDVVWKLELQNVTMRSILVTLQAPLDTQAKELRRRAEDAYLNGWYEEALADFLEAERKNYQDFAVHRSIALIYMYHLIDFPKALDYFGKAAKYARPRSAAQAAEAKYFAGLVCAIEQNPTDAVKHMEEALSLNAGLLDAAYMKGTFWAQLRDSARSCASVELAIKGDPRYHARAALDPALDPVRSDMKAFLEKILVSARSFARARLEKVQASLWGALSDTRGNAEKICSSLVQRMASAKSYGELMSLTHDADSDETLQKAEAEIAVAAPYASYYRHGKLRGDLILPGFGAAGVRLGETMNSVKETHGTPETDSTYEQYQSRYFCYDKRGFDVYFEGPTYRANAVFLYADKQDNHSAFNGSTPEGVNVRSTRTEVEQVLGKPKQILGSATDITVYYPTLTVTYQGADATDMKAKVKCLSVQVPKT